MKKRPYAFWLILLFTLLISVPVRSEWTEVSKLTAFDGAAYDQFGFCTAIDGNYAIIGSPYSDPKGTTSGSAYVYHREGESWNLQTKLVPSDGGSWDYFGQWVGISGDFVVVGAPFSTNNGGVYIFKRNGTSWVEQCKLIPSEITSPGFGLAVAISSDFVLVTDPFYNYFGQDTGAAFIFRYVDSNWVEQTILIAEDAAADNAFGTEAALCGNYALIGVHNNNSAYIFKRSDDLNDNNWYQQIKLIPSDANTGDQFGGSVSIDGSFALIGNVSDDDNGYNSGSAYIFKRSDDPNDPKWYEHQKLTAPDAHEKHFFGRHVSMSGRYAAVSAWGDNDMGSAAGAVYIFNYDGSTWNFEEKILTSDGSESDNLGPVSINGNYLLASAPMDDDMGTHSGSVYVFKLLECPLGDLNNDCWVDFIDYSLFSKEWMLNILPIDLAPNGGDGSIDFHDFSVFSYAWQSITSSPNWNSKCDIAPQGGDNIIDIFDLTEFASYWLCHSIVAADIFPPYNPDGIVDILDLAALLDNWLSGPE